MTPPPITQVHPQTLKARLDAGEALVIVDVRETWEYSLAHIPGSINFPLGELADCVMELDAEDEIIVCCHHGARSYEGAQILVESGFPRVANMIGGIDAWSCFVDPSIPRYREGG
jgi:rhodanese-related sulfurtransferase